MSVSWNPWHGCRKYSEGCVNCYVYRMDSRYEKDSSQITKNGNFRLPVMKNRQKEYKVPSGEMVYTCFTSDFLLEQADEWRREAWEMIKERSDLRFLFITKRITRFEKCIPDDWGDGYDNVIIGCTAENQRRADERLPVFLSLPIKHRIIICEPLLEKIDLTPYLNDKVNRVIAGGESGMQARVCDFEWVTDIRNQCLEKKVPFHFKQTGAKFRKNGKLYFVERKFQHSQAKKAGIDITSKNFKKI